MKKIKLLLMITMQILLITACSAEKPDITNLDYSNPSLISIESPGTFSDYPFHDYNYVELNKGNLESFEGVLTEIITETDFIVMVFNLSKVACRIKISEYLAAEVHPNMKVRVLGFVESNFRFDGHIREYTLYEQCKIDKIYTNSSFDFNFIDNNTYDFSFPYNSTTISKLDEYNTENITITGIATYIHSGIRSTKLMIMRGNESVVFIDQDYYDTGLSTWVSTFNKDEINEGDHVVIHAVLYYETGFSGGIVLYGYKVQKLS